MNEEFQIVCVEKIEDPIWEAVGRGLHHYNVQQAGPDQTKSVCFVLLSADQEIMGGVIGETHWGWLYISLMFVKEEARGRGYGHQLLMLAEAEARQRGATHAYLDTFSFQAPEFYQKHGYQVFGELSDFPTGQTRYYLKKELS
jgi:GNAT superfamily N-acetyltransferase